MIFTESRVDHWPPFERITGYDPRTDEVWLAASIFGNERQVVLCMTYDGYRPVMVNGRFFAPVSWLKREYPQAAAEIQMAARNIRTGSRVFIR